MQETMEEVPERSTTSSNGMKEDSTCHGLHKRFNTITGNNESSDAAGNMNGQHLIIRSESPSITPERIFSNSMDSPSVTGSGASRFSTPNHRILRKKPPPLSPYRSTSSTSLSPNCDGCIASSGFITTRQNFPAWLVAGNRYIDRIRPRRITLVCAYLIMAILLSIFNIAFVSLESLKASSSPTNLPTSHITGLISNKSKRRRRDTDSRTNASLGTTVKKLSAVLHSPRIICLSCNGHLPSTIQPSKYAIDSYASEFSDLTQLYPKFSSNDVLPIKPYDPLLNEIEGYGNCVPVNSSWQRSFYPSCNSFHELDLKVGLRRKSMDLFGFKGYWRHAWKIIDDDFLSGYLNKRFLSKFVYNGNLLNKHTQSATLATMAQAGLSAELPHVVLKTLR